MPSKLDLLREGHAIEFEPGLSGRLNKEKKTLELSNGRVLNVANDRDYFPADESQLRMSKQREYAEQGAKGPVREFLHQYTSQGIPRGAGDWVSYLTQSGEDYAQRNAANAEVSQRISQESPYLSAAATGANIATDLALTRGMSGLKAAPLLTLGSAGSRIATDPENVMAETATAAIGGKLLDAGGNWLSKAANRRAESRALPSHQQAVRKSNELQNNQYDFLKQNVKNSNESKLKQYQEDLNSRQNKIIKEQNEYDQRKLQRDAEIIKLKNQYEMDKAQRSANIAQSESEYLAKKQAADLENKRMAEKFKLDQLQYERDLKMVPQLQKEAQKEFSENVIKNSEAISNTFPKDSKVYSSQLEVNDFINRSLNKSGLAASKEASQSAKILKSIFPEGESITARELSARYRALEESIQRSSPEVASILNEFKQHLGGKIPTILTDTLAYTRVMPTLKKQVEKSVLSVLDSMNISGHGVASQSFIKSRATSNLRKLFEEMTPPQFYQKMQNGEIRDNIIKSVMSESDFSTQGLSALKGAKKSINMTSEELSRRGIDIPNPSRDKYNEFISRFGDKLDRAIANAELKMIAVDIDAAKKLGKTVSKTYGTAEPVAPPTAPSAPTYIEPISKPPEIPQVSPVQIPPPLSAPGTPPMPSKPSLMEFPQPPIPIAEPRLAPPQGGAERVGDLMEKNLMGGRGIADNPLAKLAGLKYLLGSAALPAEAGYLGLNALTSPGVVGEASRMAFKQGGIRAIESWAQRYPSYNNGILQDPRERRSLTKEIEDDPSIPIEQKALFQSKINRGKPLSEKL